MNFGDFPLKVKVQYIFGVAKISNIFGAWLIFIWYTVYAGPAYVLRPRDSTPWGRVSMSTVIT